MPGKNRRPDTPHAHRPSIAAEPLVYDREQLCAVLNTSRATLDRLQAAGKVPRPLRLGGQRRWSVDEIRAWIAAGMPPRDEWERRKRTAAG